MPEVNCQVALLLVHCRFPEAQSLKDKRMVVRSLKDRVRQKFNVAVAELDGQDKWQVATLGFVFIGNDHRHLDESAQHVLTFVESFDRLQIYEHTIEFI